MEKNSDYLIIVPAYNEEKTIKELVNGIKKYGDVCVINDCSQDSTLQILNGIDEIKIINHTVNTHIPGALIDGMKFAVENNYEYAITIDAGLSHNPNEIPLFIDSEFAELVIGSRIKKLNTPFYRRVVSLLGNFIYNVSLDFPRSLVKKSYYKDISSGFRRYSNRAMRLLISKKMKSHSFDFQFESTMHIYKSGFIISEVSITYNFSNSSFNWNVMKDCLFMCLKVVFRLY